MLVRWVRLLVILSVLVGAVAVSLPPATAGAQDDAAATLDCSQWRYGPDDQPGSLPAEFDVEDYKRTSRRDERPELFDSPQNHCGQKGSAVDLAFGLTLGSPEVVIAVLDSGIKWRNAEAMADLATEAHIDLVEAPPPCVEEQADGDCNGDGVFNITDFEPLDDLNGNGTADPEDLILDPVYSDGVDDDGDGYVDDISGWDFLYGDNNPFDTVDYGHGTNQARGSVAAANGDGSVGNCPGCQFLPVRVSDSFVADAGRFAAGVFYALDQDADVIQEALGALNNPPQAQQAIDEAYDRGVVVVASMADEASKHPNLPASLERTMAVNSVTEKELALLGGPVEGYLALNGCTNYGGRTFVSVPSSSCSSEATGQSSGMVGLLESYAREIGLSAHPSLSGDAGDNVLSANEVLQLVRSTADDIDFSTPNDVDPANNFGEPSGSPLIDTVRYPTRAGWDSIHGYGRINTYELLAALDDGAIPPEAMIDTPTWFEVLPATGTAEISGSVAAERADSYDYRVEWAPGLQPPEYPATDTWTVISEDAGRTEPLDGALGTLDLASVAAQLPDEAAGAPVDSEGRPDEDRFAVRLRVEVTAHGGPGDGLVGEMQKQVVVHDDPDLVDGYPATIPGVGASSPLFVDIDRDGSTEMILGTDHGSILALHPDGTQPDGFPLSTPVSPWWPTESASAEAQGIEEHRAAVLLGGPAVGDLDGDGRYEIVAADLNGGVTIWDAEGTELAGMRVDSDYSRDDPSSQDEFNRTKASIYASPALGDLDLDGDLEIVAAAADRHVYAWHHDGEPVEGFPVLVVDSEKIESVDPVTHKVVFQESSGVDEGGELLATPALADLTGDERPEIIIGGQEQYEESPQMGDGADVVALLELTGSAGNSRVYAISPDGTAASASPVSERHPDAQAYLPGWPVAVGMASTGLLPTIGGGVSMPAVTADIDPSSPSPEVAVGTGAGPLYVFDAAGNSIYGSDPGGSIPLTWTAGTDLARADAFGENRNSEDLVASMLGFGGPSVGDLDGDGPDGPIVAAPTAGLSRLIDLLAPDLQLPNDDQLSAWDGQSGDPVPGSPQASGGLAMFVAPALADLDGDGAAEIIAGTSTGTVDAFDTSGEAAAGWPKLTGGWNLGTPGVGDWDGDGTLEVAQPRRDGRLFVWTTASTADPVWSTWGCDMHHTGACVEAALPLAADSDPNSGNSGSGSSALRWALAAVGLALVAAVAFILIRRRRS